MFSDEYLDYWGAVYVTARLCELGIPFQDFLADPWECLKGVELQPTPFLGCCRPLLPRQRQVVQALWKSWESQTNEARAAIPKSHENRLLAEAENRKLGSAL